MSGERVTPFGKVALAHVCEQLCTEHRIPEDRRSTQDGNDDEYGFYDTGYADAWGEMAEMLRGIQDDRIRDVLARANQPITTTRGVQVVDVVPAVVLSPINLSAGIDDDPTYRIE